MSPGGDFVVANNSLVVTDVTVAVSSIINNSAMTTDVTIADLSIIPAEALFYILMVNFWGIGLATSVFGIITNILNIIIFLKQGRRDAVNISLLGLAITDLGSLLTLTMTNICFIPSFQSLDLPFVPMDFMYIWAWLHIMLTRITSWITVYVTFERCLCVSHPLKVKVFITPKRTVVYILFLYLIMLVSVVPVYYPTRAAKIFDSSRNKTINGISLLPNRNDIETVSFVINCIVPTSAFVSVIICTTILVKQVRRKEKWRTISTMSRQTDNLSRRDTKVIKMVVFMSAVFIICYFPGTAIYIWVMIDPDMRIDGKHLDLLLANFSILFHLESVNASSGIFIYLSMSSRYKRTFLQTFCCFRS